MIKIGIICLHDVVERLMEEGLRSEIVIYSATFHFPPCIAAVPHNQILLCCADTQYSRTVIVKEPRVRASWDITKGLTAPEIAVKTEGSRTRPPVARMPQTLVAAEQHEEAAPGHDCAVRSPHRQTRLRIFQKLATVKVIVVDLLQNVALGLFRGYIQLRAGVCRLCQPDVFDPGDAGAQMLRGDIAVIHDDQLTVGMRLPHETAQRLPHKTRPVPRGEEARHESLLPGFRHVREHYTTGSARNVDDQVGSCERLLPRS